MIRFSPAKTCSFHRSFHALFCMETLLPVAYLSSTGSAASMHEQLPAGWPGSRLTDKHSDALHRAVILEMAQDIVEDCAGEDHQTSGIEFCMKRRYPVENLCGSHRQRF